MGVLVFLDLGFRAGLGRSWGRFEQCKRSGGAVGRGVGERGGNGVPVRSGVLS